MSEAGQFIMIESKNIRSLGRIARGIIGIKLETGDYVQSARVIPIDTKEIFSISTEGYGKLTAITEFNVTNTNTKGVKIQKAEKMADFLALNNKSDILINSTTTQIRINYSDIPIALRGTLGVKLIKLTNNKVVGISSL
jgi:DNA gyrase subunit A